MAAVTLERIGELAIEMLAAQRAKAEGPGGECLRPGPLKLLCRAEFLYQQAYCERCKGMEALKATANKARRRLREAVRRYEKGATT